MSTPKRKQYAALPYRMVDGHAEVMLITSRETRRWVVPKGWPMIGRKPCDAAAREAFEEAGILGRVNRKPAGRYCYEKLLKNGKVATCEVDVFPFQVEQELTRWPEQVERTRRWFSPAEAATVVAEDGLKDLLGELTSLGRLEGAKPASPAGKPKPP